MKQFTTLIQPVVTEKSSMLQEKGIYTFLITKDATKVDVKDAIEKIYGKKPKKVTVSICSRKVRLLGRGRLMTKRRPQKIARVSLKKGETIDPNKLGSEKASKAKAKAKSKDKIKSKESKSKK